jgi:hypothetical protein
VKAEGWEDTYIKVWNCGGIDWLLEGRKLLLTISVRKIGHSSIEFGRLKLDFLQKYGQRFCFKGTCF